MGDLALPAFYLLPPSPRQRCWPQHWLDRPEIIGKVSPRSLWFRSRWWRVKLGEGGADPGLFPPGVRESWRRPWGGAQCWGKSWGEGKVGGGERVVGWHNVLPRADQLYSRNWFCLSPLSPSFRESMYWLVPVDSGWSFQHFLLTRSHVFVTTKSYIDS